MEDTTVPTPPAAPLVEAPAATESTTPSVPSGPQPHEGRIIIRNLPFDLKEQHLKPHFQQFGKIEQVNIPINNTNNLNKGFAFVEYSTRAEALKAVEGMNGQKYKGRTVAIELSLPKGRYETKVSNIVAHSNLPREDVIIPKALREEREEARKKREDKEQEKEAKKAKHDKEREKNKASADSASAASNNKTLFVRNIGYDTTQ
jgi:RNA recognition motif-containing protein